MFRGKEYEDLRNDHEVNKSSTLKEQNEKQSKIIINAKKASRE